METKILEALASIKTLLTISMKNVFSVADVALILDCTEDNVYHLANSNKLAYYKQGKRIWFKREDVEDYQTQNRIESKSNIQAVANTYVVTHKRKN